MLLTWLTPFCGKALSNTIHKIIFCAALCRLYAIKIITKKFFFVTPQSVLISETNLPTKVLELPQTIPLQQLTGFYEFVILYKVINIKVFRKSKK